MIRHAIAMCFFSRNKKLWHAREFRLPEAFRSHGGVMWGNSAAACNIQHVLFSGSIELNVFSTAKSIPTYFPVVKSLKA